MEFLVGQAVTWISQARGNWTTKMGLVCQIVPPGKKPDLRYTNLHRGSGCGSSRNHESYVVVDGSTYYWPRVSHLKPMKHDPTRTVPAENFLQTLAANVANADLDDKGFREFVKSTLPIVRF